MVDKIIEKTHWDDIIESLEKWREELQSYTEPSVTTIAEGYKQDPWAVLASTILSLRTKDEVTLVSSRALLGKAPTPEALVKLSEKEIEKLIYPAGFYRTKASNLKKTASLIIEKHNGQVPNNMEDLLALPGVGRKTANLVLTEAFDLYGICVDTHVHKISNRTGWVSTSTPDQTEQILREVLPQKYWKRINALLVVYGQQICRPVSPFCSKCVIEKHCKRKNVEKSR